jgi:hypothetical protein
MMSAARRVPAHLTRKRAHRRLAGKTGVILRGAKRSRRTHPDQGVRLRRQGRGHGRGGSCDCAQDDMHFGIRRSFCAERSAAAESTPTRASGCGVRVEVMAGVDPATARRMTCTLGSRHRWLFPRTSAKTLFRGVRNRTPQPPVYGPLTSPHPHLGIGACSVTAAPGWELMTASRDPHSR